MRRLVIFASPNDPHVVRVSNRLLEAGMECTILSPVSDEDVEEFPSLFLETPERSSELADAIWWKRNKFQLLFMADEEDQRRYFESITRSSYVDMLTSNVNARVFNNDSGKHLDKLKQLKLARNLGMSVPNTLISSSKRDILNFIEEHGRCIIKPLSISFVPANAKGGQTFISIMTNELSADEVLNAPDDAISSCPVILQNYIEKNFELRVVAFGDMIVSYKLNSQDVDGASIDWRRKEGWPGMAGSDPFVLPEHVSTFIRKFLYSANLDSGVFDFAVSPNEDCIFFECNPSGQWAALEGQTMVVTDLFVKGFLDIMRNG